MTFTGPPRQSRSRWNELRNRARFTGPLKKMKLQ